MKQLVSSLLRHSVMRYALVGVSNTAVGFGTIWLCLRGLGLGDALSNAIGYVVGFTWSFLLNRAWTFSHSGHAGVGMLRYALVCLASYLANLLVVLGLARVFGPGHLYAQAAGMITYSGLAYLGARYYAFPAGRSAAQPGA
jgi:putative flippase GtrA